MGTELRCESAIMKPSRSEIDELSRIVMNMPQLKYWSEIQENRLLTFQMFGEPSGNLQTLPATSNNDRKGAAPIPNHFKTTLWSPSNLENAGWVLLGW